MIDHSGSPAAPAEDATVNVPNMTGRSSAKGDTGLTIACVRCALKTGSWGLLSRPRAMLDGFRW